MFLKFKLFKHIKVQLFLIALFTSLVADANTAILENNLEIQSNKNNIEANLYDFKINQSSFFPELTIKSGVGSEYTIDKTATTKGPYLYLDGRINLYNAGKDFNQNNLIKEKSLKLLSEHELLSRKLKIQAYKLITAIKTLENDNIYLALEIKENENQLKMAKKKVDAGLTTSADLLDFQIKNENLLNETTSNNYKINENEKDLYNLFGGNTPLEQIKNEFKISEFKLSVPQDTGLRPEIKMMESELASSNLEFKNAKSEYLPIIEIEGKLGSITPNSKLFPGKSEHQIALNLSISLFSGFNTNAKISKAILDSTLKERQLRQLKIDLESKVEFEKKKIELNEKIISTLESSLSKATKYKELTLSEYKKGIKNSSDVINASDKKFELTRKINEIKIENNFLIYSFNTNFITSKE